MRSDRARAGGLHRHGHAARVAEPRRRRRGARRALLLRFERVNTFYGKSHILNDATLDVRAGEIVALLGRNGAGKSTLLKTLVGLVPPASGTHRATTAATSPACRRRDIARLGIGYVPQGRGLFAGMTVAENLALGRLARATDGAHGVVWSEEKIFEFFPRLKERMARRGRLPLGRRAADGGGGARALGQRRSCCCWTSRSRAWRRRWCRSCSACSTGCAAQASIVIVEHNLDLVLALADRVFALERGAVFHQGPAEPLLTDLDYRKQILWL